MKLARIPFPKFMEKITVREETMPEDPKAETIVENHDASMSLIGNMAMTRIDPHDDPYFRMDCLRTAAQLYQGTGTSAATLIAAANELLDFVLPTPEPKE